MHCDQTRCYHAIPHNPNAAVHGACSALPPLTSGLAGRRATKRHTRAVGSECAPRLRLFLRSLLPSLHSMSGARPRPGASPALPPVHEDAALLDTAPPAVDPRPPRKRRGRKPRCPGEQGGCGVPGAKHQGSLALLAGCARHSGRWEPPCRRPPPCVASPAGAGAQLLLRSDRAAALPLVSVQQHAVAGGRDAA